MLSLSPEVYTYFDEHTATACHVLKDPSSPACAIIDSVMDIDAASGWLHTYHADVLINDITAHGWNVEWILETQLHFSHVSAAPYLASTFGSKVAVGAGICKAEQAFAGLFCFSTDPPPHEGRFDWLFEDGAMFRVGNLNIRVMHTPGHSPTCVTYVVGDAAFIGNTLMMPDLGTARTDLPGGCARQLHGSIQRILRLSDATRLFLGHDCRTSGRDQYFWESTVEEQKVQNPHVKEALSLAEFIEMREELDRRLSTPNLFLPAVQINMRAGNLPPPETDGHVYLKIPINKF